MKWFFLSLEVKFFTSRIGCTPNIQIQFPMSKRWHGLAIFHLHELHKQFNPKNDPYSIREITNNPLSKHVGENRAIRTKPENIRSVPTWKFSLYCWSHDILSERGKFSSNDFLFPVGSKQKVEYVINGPITCGIWRRRICRGMNWTWRTLSPLPSAHRQASFPLQASAGSPWK